MLIYPTLYCTRKNLIIVNTKERLNSRNETAIVRNAIDYVFTTDAITSAYITAILHNGDKIILWDCITKEESERDKMLTEMQFEFEKILDFLAQ